MPERIGAWIKRGEQALIATKTAALKSSGLTGPQYTALWFLAESPGISAAALARACMVTPPTMNTVLKNLQDHGLVTRTPHPWHGNVLETHLTEAGRAALADADAAAVHVEQTLADSFTDEERDALRALLGRCVDVLDSLRG